jgi:hypothetical protein
VKLLGEDRAEGAPRHDDRAFRTEGAASADGNRRGERFEQGDFELYAAATEQNGLQSFRNAVPADLL